MTLAASPRTFVRDHGIAIADAMLAVVASWVASAIYFSHGVAMEHYGAALPLSSDNVAPYLLFDDLFRRHLPIGGWRYPEAPFFAPDILLGWFVYALAGTLVPAVELYALASATCFLLLVRVVLKRAGYDAGAWRIWLLLWIAGCAIGARAAPSAFSHLYGYIFMPYIHSGMLLGVVAGLAMLLRTEAPSWRTLAAFSLLVLAMLASDRLFALQFVVPALAACVLARELRRFIVPLVVLVIASETLNVLSGLAFSTESNDRTSAGVALQTFGTSAFMLARNDPFDALLLLLGIGATGFALLRPASLPRRLAAFAMLSSLLPLVAVLVLGRFHSIEEVRYLQSAQLLGLPLAGALAAFARRGSPQYAHEILFALAAIAIAAAAMTGGADRSALRGYLVDQSTCLRDAIAREHLHVGAATYWRANEMTARFPDASALVPLSTDAAPRMRNIVDLGWLSPLAPGATLPTLDFVDEHGYTADALDHAFGPAARRFTCPRSSYRIYAPEDGALAHLYRYADWLPSQLVERIGVALVPAAAWAADPTFAAGDAIRATGWFATPTPVLATALDVPRGRIDVELAYALDARSPGARVHWQVAIVDDNGAPVTELGAGELAATPGTIHVALPLGARPDSAGALALALAAEGDVDLRVASVRVAVR